VGCEIAFCNHKALAEHSTLMSIPSYRQVRRRYLKIILAADNLSVHEFQELSETMRQTAFETAWEIYQSDRPFGASDEFELEYPSCGQIEHGSNALTTCTDHNGPLAHYDVSSSVYSTKENSHQDSISAEGTPEASVKLANERFGIGTEVYFKCKPATILEAGEGADWEIQFEDGSTSHVNANELILRPESDNQSSVDLAATTTSTELAPGLDKEFREPKNSDPVDLTFELVEVPFCDDSDDPETDDCFGNEIYDAVIRTEDDSGSNGEDSEWFNDSDSNNDNVISSYETSGTEQPHFSFVSGKSCNTSSSVELPPKRSAVTGSSNEIPSSSQRPEGVDGAVGDTIEKCFEQLVVTHENSENDFKNHLSPNRLTPSRQNTVVILLTVLALFFSTLCNVVQFNWSYLKTTFSSAIDGQTQAFTQEGNQNLSRVESNINNPNSKQVDSESQLTDKQLSVEYTLRILPRGELILGRIKGMQDGIVELETKIGTRKISISKLDDDSQQLILTSGEMLLSAIPHRPCPNRTWKSFDGRNARDARLIGMSNNVVILQSETGRLLLTKKASLSVDDLDYIEKAIR
jgi:hypothetical protein